MDKSFYWTSLFYGEKILKKLNWIDKKQHKVVWIMKQYIKIDTLRMPLGQDFSVAFHLL